jgi:hypothetical protein
VTIDIGIFLVYFARMLLRVTRFADALTGPEYTAFSGWKEAKPRAAVDFANDITTVSILHAEQCCKATAIRSIACIVRMDERRCSQRLLASVDELTRISGCLQ